MANLSDTQGTLTFTTPNPHALAIFLYLRELEERKAYYNTTILNIEGHINLQDDPYVVIKQIEDILLNNNPTFDPTKGKEFKSEPFDFYGTGRWSFESNLNWFMDAMPDPTGKPEWLTEDDFELLLTTPFKVELEYADAEPGCNFIIEANATIEYDGENSYVDCYVKSESNYTADKLVEYGFYDETEVVSPRRLAKNYHLYFDNEYNKDAFYLEHKDEIVQALRNLPNQETVYDSTADLFTEEETLQPLLHEIGFYGDEN